MAFSLAEKTRNALFDTAWYLAQRGKLPKSARSPLNDYLSEGWRQGLDPHPLFSVKRYLERYPDVAAAGVEPLSHFVASGAAEGRDPHPLFATSRYLAHYPDVQKAGVNPLLHFLVHGEADGRSPHALFHTGYYLHAYGWQRSNAINPLVHYLTAGAAAGYESHPAFDSQWYATHDRHRGGRIGAPTVHYVLSGRLYGAEPNALVSADWYRGRYKLDASTDPFEHYLDYGHREGNDAGPFLKSDWYGAQAYDLAGSGLDHMSHFLRYGAERGLSPHPLFDLRLYLDRNIAARLSGMNAVAYYRRYGGVDRVSPHRELDRLFDEAPAGDAEFHIRPFLSYTTRVPTIACAPIPAPAGPPSLTAGAPPEQEQALIGGAGVRWSASGWGFFHAEFGGEAGRDVTGWLDFLGQRHGRKVTAADLAADREAAALAQETAALVQAAGSEEDPDVSIIVPVYDCALYTLVCIRSLMARTTRASFEIILADDCSSDATAGLFGGMGGRLRHLRHATNLGFIRNCNAAAAAARGKTLVFLNNDTIVLPGWLDALVETLRRNPKAGVAGSKLLNADGTLQEAGGLFWREGNAWNFGRGADPVLPQFSYLRPVDYISGASMAIPKAVWERLGGFDETFVPAYCEDSDFAFRCRAAGFDVLLQPASQVIHHEGVSHGRDISGGIKAYQERNQKTLIARHRAALERDHFPDGMNLFQARDRSRRKAHVLIVDHYVPQPDRDAGSRTIFQIVRLFAEAGYQAHFWPDNLHYDRPNARLLQDMGVEVLYGPQLSGRFADWMKVAGPHLSHVLLSRPDVASRYLSDVRAHTRAPVSYYGHDLHFARLELEHRTSGRPEIADEAARLKALETQVWSKVDTVFYPTQDEVDIVRRMAPETAADVMPAFAFEPAELAAADAAAPEARAGLLFVGGFRHGPNVDGLIWFVREVLPLVAAAHPHVRLDVVGSNATDEVTALASHHVRILGFVSDDDLARLYASTRTVVAPLRFGAGVKGKVIEAFRFGVPVATTSVGAQGIDARGALSVADEPHALAARIKTLLDDDAAWLRQSHAAAAFVREAYGQAHVARHLSRYFPGLGETPKSAV